MPSEVGLRIGVTALDECLCCPKTKTAAISAAVSGVGGVEKSEREFQSHLNLPWSANGFVHDPQAAERRGRI
jgi:hypothetical protein